MIIVTNIKYFFSVYAFIYTFTYTYIQIYIKKNIMKMSRILGTRPGIDTFTLMLHWNTWFPLPSTLYNTYFILKSKSLAELGKRIDLRSARVWPGKTRLASESREMFARMHSRASRTHALTQAFIYVVQHGARGGWISPSPAHPEPAIEATRTT